MNEIVRYEPPSLDTLLTTVNYHLELCRTFIDNDDELSALTEWYSAYSYSELYFPLEYAIVFQPYHRLQYEVEKHQEEDIVRLASKRKELFGILMNWHTPAKEQSNDRNTTEPPF